MTLQTHNVINEAKTLTVEERKLSIKRYPVALASFSVRYDINIGSLIRNSNAFACQHFVMIGDKKWDRRPSVGMHNYENIVHLKDSSELLQFAIEHKYNVVAVDKIPNVSYPITGVEKYPDNPLFVMGSERSGVPDSVLRMSSFCVHIEQFGIVRSLNVATASGIILYDWHVKYGKSQNS